MISLDVHSPLQAAVDQMAGRTVAGSPMLSKEWEQLPAEIRLRAMFSARVEHERTLSEMQSRILSGLSGEKVDGATMDRSRFVEEMSQMVRATGYKRPEGTSRKSVQNLRSRARLELIWNMNVAQARGYAKWLADMNPDALENEPCYELIRVMDRMEIRNWPQIWADAGGAFYDGAGSNDDYPNAPGRMIAKKTDPIWTRISRFNTPWPPFDWGSGMGLRDIGIDEAEAFGIVKPEDDFHEDARKVVVTAAGFNAGHSSSASNLPQPSKESLRSAFGDAIRFDNDRILLQRNLTPETDEQRKLDIGQSLARRAREVADAGRDVIRRAIGSENGALALPPGLQSAEGWDEILSSTSAVSVGRKLLYHEGWPSHSEGIAAVLRSYLPDYVSVMVRDGHIHAWRPDLLDLTPERIQSLSLTYENGMLLGYGQNLFDEPSVSVMILDQEQRVMGGFRSNPHTALPFARARAKDFQDALGMAVRIFLDGKEVKP